MRKLPLFIFLVVSLISLTSMVDGYQALDIRQENSAENEFVQLVSVYASPDRVAKAVKVNLDVENGEVREFIPGDDKFLTIGTCENDQTFTASEICVDVASTGGEVMDGDLLFQFTVFAEEDPNQVVITKSPGTGYLDANNVFVDVSVDNANVDNGVAAEEVDYMTIVLVSIAFLSLISIVLVGYLYSNRNKKDQL